MARPHNSPAVGALGSQRGAREAAPSHAPWTGRRPPRSPCRRPRPGCPAPVKQPRFTATYMHTRHLCNPLPSLGRTRMLWPLKYSHLTRLITLPYPVPVVPQLAKQRSCRGRGSEKLAPHPGRRLAGAHSPVEQLERHAGVTGMFTCMSTRFDTHAPSTLPALGGAAIHGMLTLTYLPLAAPGSCPRPPWTRRCRRRLCACPCWSS